MRSEPAGHEPEWPRLGVIDIGSNNKRSLLAGLHKFDQFILAAVYQVGRRASVRLSVRVRLCVCFCVRVSKKDGLFPSNHWKK